MATEMEDLAASLNALARQVLPSGWSFLGMLKHLALADEHYWFR